MRSFKTPHQKRIEKFMRLAEQEIPTKPVIPSLEIRKLRATLILEEALETIEALGFTVVSKYTTEFTIEETIKPDLELIADGCADISVVTIGTLSACGIADMNIMHEVDQANLRKFGPGSKKREDGKWLKPPDWRPPDIKGELKKQGWKP